MLESKNLGRLAGLLWLGSATTQAFSLAYARPRLLTAGSIVANEALFRAAIAGSLFSYGLLFFFGLVVYRLFKADQAGLATVLLASIMIATAIAVVNLLNSLGALIMLSPADYLLAFSSDQRSGLALVFLRVNNYGLGLLEFFWGPYLFAFGLLVLRSRRMPAILGVLLLIMSVGFPLNTLTKLLAPQFYPALFTQAAALLGALATVPTTLWLLIKGAGEPRVRLRAA
ncbi:MAG: DUF4386 domain-containing protein [Anaerolineales bacterium]